MPILFLLIIKQLQRKLKKTLLFKVQNSLVKYILLTFGYAYEKGHTFLNKTKNKYYGKFNRNSTFFKRTIHREKHLRFSISFIN